MKKENEKLERLANISESYEPNMELANEAIAKISQKKSVHDSSKPMIRRALFACGSCLLVVAIFLPVFFHFYNGREPKYVKYSDDDLDFAVVGDMQGFMEEHNYHFHYFSDGALINQFASIKENGEIAFVMQTGYFFGETGLDEIKLNIVLSPTAEFDFYDDYNTLTQKMTMGETEIDYSMVLLNNTIIYRAKFLNNKLTYYLQINSQENDSQILQEYINILFE